ncbi:hypothetical protein RQ734_19995 [Roseomonas mucosa]|uniref:hypothetical protein n=1 Tax=Roseomonas mucosa TaxID=207340 RepID=UPI0028CF073E|nr:hypothetical protein [Roseomonas mucosa]MDT8278349.1 hypothetical protein [Roseomonas mucosa]
MLAVDMIARIRRAHFVDGKSIKQITREMGLVRNTVRRVLRSGETAFTYERQVQPRPKLGAWTEELERRLSANERLPSRERLDLIRVFEDLQVALPHFHGHCYAADAAVWNVAAFCSGVR